MTGPKDPPLQRGSGRVLMVGGLVLAVVAAVVLALGAQDAGLLRLGIVAALWAALFGTFAAVRMRREISAGADRAEDMQTIYRMELDREIAARREHELTVERELREQIEQREREEITALRGELQSLRETLRHLMGGDVLVERVALRAESTRLLPMPEPAPAVADNHGRTSSGPTPAAPRSLGGAAPPARRTGADPRDVQHRDVQHRDVQHRDVQHRGAPASPRSEPVEAPARPAAASRPRRDPAFRPAVGDPGLRPAAGDAARPAAGDPAFRPAAGDAARPEPSIFASTAAELAGRSAPAPAARPWQPAVSAEQQSARRQRTVSPPQRPGSVPPEPSAAPVSPAPAATPPAATPPAATPAASGPGVGGGRHSGPQYSSYSSSTHGNGTGAHSNGNGTGAHGNGTGAHSNGNGTHSNGNGTHSNSTGAHSNSNGAGPSGGGRRRAPEQTPAGTPAGGRPVGELLAAYGEGSAPRHRRRRAAD